MSRFDEKMIEGLVSYVFLMAIVIGVVLTLRYGQSDNPETCTCRFAQHRVHFGDQYTKTNRKCIDLGSGSVQVGDTVYLDVKWFSNECE